MDYDKVMALRNEGQEYAYSDREVMLYALAIGMGSDPLDGRELPFVSEFGSEGGGLEVVPTFATVAAYGSGPGGMGVNRAMVVDGGREITFHRPMPAAAKLLADSSVLAVYDKGKEKGAIIRHQTVLMDEAREPYATIVSSRIARGDGGCGGTSEAPPAPHQRPDRAPDLSIDIDTRPDQALLYRLCGDRNPLHASPEAARRAGFERPILHGLCTCGLVCRAILQTYADYDPAAFAHHAVRFSSPVFPGETVTVDLWRDGSRISHEARIKERDAMVVKNGLSILN